MAKTLVKRRSRDPDATREKLLHAAFEEIYRRGFQAASLDTILTKAGVTKGALYHHFPDKAALGYAVVDEVVKGLLLRAMGRAGAHHRRSGDRPAAGPAGRSAGLTTREVELGCPLNNLAQEMSPLDQRFRRGVNATFDIWTGAVAKDLERGQAEGTVRKDLDARKVAAFVVASIEGSFGLAKGAQSAAMLRSNLEVLSSFLESLRPASKQSGKARAKPAGTRRRRA